jgi:hypothetical protein
MVGDCSITMRVSISQYISQFSSIIKKTQCSLTSKEELDGRAVSALGVRSQKLSTGPNGQS